jgi:hypothetical protein
MDVLRRKIIYQVGRQTLGTRFISNRLKGTSKTNKFLEKSGAASLLNRLNFSKSDKSQGGVL